MGTNSAEVFDPSLPPKSTQLPKSVLGKSKQLLLSNLSILDTAQQEYLLQISVIRTFLTSSTGNNATNTDFADFENIFTQNGHPVLRWRGKSLHSRIDPLQEASRQYVDVELTRYESIIYLGGDMLYSLDALDTISKTRNTGVQNHQIGKSIHEQPPAKPYGHLVIIFLNDEFLLEVISSRPLEVLKRFKSVCLVSLTNRTFLEKYLSTYVKFPHLVLTNKVIYQSAQDLLRIHAHLNQQFKNQTTTFFTRYYFEKRWMKNCLHNFSSSSRAYSIKSLMQFFHGKDAILVGAGISLAEHIPTLQKICREQLAQIITVDTALPVLLESGITPDFVIALDGGYHNAGDFSRLPESKTSLITYPHLYPSVIRDFQGKIFYFTFAKNTGAGDDFGEEKRVGIVDEIIREWVDGGKVSERHPGVLPQSGNVSVVATTLLSAMGFDRVTFTGIDFSAYFFANHPPSTIHYNYYLKNQNRFSPMETMEFEETYFRMSHEEIEQFQKTVVNTTNHAGIDHLSHWNVATFLWNESASQLHKYIHRSNNTKSSDPQQQTEWRQLISVCSKKTTLEITSDELLSALRQKNLSHAQVAQKQLSPISLYEQSEIIRFVKARLKQIHNAQSLLQEYWNGKNRGAVGLDQRYLSYQILSKQLADISPVIKAIVEAANTRETYTRYSNTHSSNNNDSGIDTQVLEFPFREVNNTLAMMENKLVLVKRLLREEDTS